MFHYLLVLAVVNAEQRWRLGYYYIYKYMFHVPVTAVIDSIKNGIPVLCTFNKLLVNAKWGLLCVTKSYVAAFSVDDKSATHSNDQTKNA